MAGSLGKAFEEISEGLAVTLFIRSKLRAAGVDGTPYCRICELYNYDPGCFHGLQSDSCSIDPFSYPFNNQTVGECEAAK